MNSIEIYAVPGFEPYKKLENDVGWDLRARLEEQETLEITPGFTYVVKTGVKINLPSNIKAKITPRSGLSTEGIIVVEGTIDPGYIGEMKVVLFSVFSGVTVIENKQRIAQLEFEYIPPIELNYVDKPSHFEHPANNRGEQGFGHTGYF